MDVVLTDNGVHVGVFTDWKGDLQSFQQMLDDHFDFEVVVKEGRLTKEELLTEITFGRTFDVQVDIGDKVLDVKVERAWIYKD